MRLISIIDNDTSVYKKPAMTLLFPCCSMRCGKKRCNSADLLLKEPRDFDIEEIIKRYKASKAKAIVCSGLEPFDSWKELHDLIMNIRYYTEDDIVIYTGYSEQELSDKIPWLAVYENIIIKFGKYIHKDVSRFDDVLGIQLTSKNQYAKIISEGKEI